MPAKTDFRQPLNAVGVLGCYKSLSGSNAPYKNWHRGVIRQNARHTTKLLHPVKSVVVRPAVWQTGLMASMKPNTIIYNADGLDGTFCRQIALMALGGEANCLLRPWSYSQPALEFPPVGNVYVMGLPLDAPFGSDEPYDCEKNWDRLTWIHNGPRAIQRTDPGVPGFRMVEVACCRLAYQYFSRRANLEDSYPAVPSSEDFRIGRVNEPTCLWRLQEYIFSAHPGQNARDFVAGMARVGRDVDWEALLTPGKLGNDECAKICRAGDPLDGHGNHENLCRWLDGQFIYSENIGSIRRRLLMPWDCEWNSMVRDETAKRERNERPA